MDNIPIGYAYGNKKQKEKYYYVEEIYVQPKFRSLGCGAKLFMKLKEEAEEMGCSSLRLNAVSKDYKRLLHFYIDEMGMEFWSAFLTMKL